MLTGKLLNRKDRVFHHKMVTCFCLYQKKHYSVEFALDVKCPVWAEPGAHKPSCSFQAILNQHKNLLSQSGVLSSKTIAWLNNIIVPQY